MEKKLLNQENEIIEINGAILTPEVIKTIKFFQDSENELIEHFREYISDAICQLLQDADDNSGLEKEETIITITNLAYCRDYLTGLKKPVNHEIQPIGH